MDKYFLCVACKTLLACITLYDIMLIMLSIYVWMIPIFMKWYLWLCLIIHVMYVILCLFILLHYLVI
jgi:hypothetical protein